jgi:outer membrane protein assembly factor BamD (BamD/ComL family)
MLLVTGCGKDEEKTGEDAVKEANALLEKAQTYIKDGDLDKAEAELKKLDEMKDLPKDLQEKIKAAKTALTTAQSGKKLKIPKLP